MQDFEIAQFESDRLDHFAGPVRVRLDATTSDLDNHLRGVTLSSACDATGPLRPSFDYPMCPFIQIWNF